MTVIEALSLGKPVVGTPVGDMPGLLSTEWLVPVDDPVALSDRIVTLLHDDDLRRRVGEANRARFEAEFDADLVRAGLDDVYTELISGSNGPMGEIDG